MTVVADFAVVLFEFDGDCCGSVRSFLVTGAAFTGTLTEAFQFKKRAEAIECNCHRKSPGISVSAATQ